MLAPTVFVVDDDPTTRCSFAALISSLHLPVEAFASGEEFLPRLQASQPGCAVIDFRLSGMDGIELHRRLLASGCHLPVILISGYLNVQTTAQAMEQGVFRVLEKPYRNGQLQSVVREALSHDLAMRSQKRYRLDFRHRLEALDVRERLTLEMVVSGSANKAIERKLGLSTRTVDRIRASILEKMDFLSFVELSAAYGAVVEADTGVHPAKACAARAGDWRARQPPRTEVAPPLRSPSPSLRGETVQYLVAALRRVQAIAARPQVAEEVRPQLREIETILSAALAEFGENIAGDCPGLTAHSDQRPAIKGLIQRPLTPHTRDAG